MNWQAVVKRMLQVNAHIASSGGCSRMEHVLPLVTSARLGVTLLAIALLAMMGGHLHPGNAQYPIMEDRTHHLTLTVSNLLMEHAQNAQPDGT